MKPRRSDNVPTLMLLTWLSIAAAPPVAGAAGFELATDDQTATVLVPESEPPCVRLAAEQVIHTIRAGQALASRGKWQHWYRGDRKMNLARIEKLTHQLTAAVETVQAGIVPEGSAP